MFRYPRENLTLPSHLQLTPSIGRPPSPPTISDHSATSGPKPPSVTMPGTTTKSIPFKSSRSRKPQQTTLSASSFTPRKGSNGNVTNGAKNKQKANGSILTFFKKAEEPGLFFQERGSGGISQKDRSDGDGDIVGWMEEEQRFNERAGSVKRRKVEEEASGSKQACTPPPPDIVQQHLEGESEPKSKSGGVQPKVRQKRGPFVEESDSEDESPPPSRRLSGINVSSNLDDADTPGTLSCSERELSGDSDTQNQLPVSLKHESTSIPDGGFEGFNEDEDYDDEFPEEGEEYQERKWMEEQRRWELGEAGLDNDEQDLFPPDKATNGATRNNTPDCPICGSSLNDISDQEASVHVNNCLDGNPSPLPERTFTEKGHIGVKSDNGRQFQKPVRPAKPGQENPFTLDSSTAQSKSAFSKLMSGHAEDAAWATAAASENASRGKPAYKRTCPFYKILPGFYICVDAFRYGAVEGQQAYFLSHFHSDHYVGLTSSWCHGPIYCSHVTANLVRQQLRVDPKWVVDLDFEKKVEVPGTQGVHVTMIPANHCPGSSLFLFEKQVGKGKNRRMQRVLHCGDFRACRAHVEHPLLRPDVMDVVSGKTQQQKIDVCYLDTTYLNPKYAFPSQEKVIKACADMCVSLNKIRKDEDDSWEQMKRERAGQGMIKFVRKDSDALNQEDNTGEEARGRLLVVVGTYSIGKERVCLGIARALDCKIYAPPSKQRICVALEDPELNARLTKDPREAQIHMTPLFEIRADTLDEYLNDYRDTFSRAVGFRPSGWNYRAPNSRFVESPSVQTVLHGANWKSNYSMRELVPQRGSTNRASCFGVPYSEHSSFRELTMFCCALRIERIIPTVNVGSAKTREKMKGWCERWAAERRKNGLFSDFDAW
ncbi:DRMBL-domain-containing protein [Patellaria atrata CBS 101060]|uniref:DRMBL-domain-containing protein n=1 Tax=Patellaria atrata CBS 101060 TaxID=1346257 RepID=A0A9P4S6Z3_9PEZI|nr:DRMBL-domain-containing protein [Patellaria atrata CBS 101060]